MKTKDFIKMLNEADPSGESHIRMEGGIPVCAELKPGYWDGPYTYTDEEGNYVTSSQGSKVDIHCMDIDDFIESNYRDNIEWEEIESKFKFDLTWSNKDQRDEKANSILKKAKESYLETKNINDSLYNQALGEMIKNAENGWEWFQDKEAESYYTWKIFTKWGKKESSNIWNTRCIQKSGLWEKLDNNKVHGYYQWIYKPKNKN